MSQNTTIPQHIIDQVSDIDIVEVVSEYVTLKRSGVNWIGLCPFHTDKSPSFYVSPSKQICKCFACGKPDKGEGGVIHFVEQMENISFPAAVRLLAKKYNIDIPEIQLSPEEEARDKRRESLYIALAAAQQQFEDNYLASQDTQHYISTVRQVSEPYRKLYGIGYAPTGNQLTKLMPSKGYKTDVLLSADIIKQNESGKHYDTFRSRAMFPYYDLQGRVIGFTGRDLTGQVEDQWKYFNTSTTDLFSKSTAIWGLWQAKKRISETGKVHIVEGQMDTVSFAQNGLQNTVAGSGTAFTDAQVKILHRFADVAVLVYDGDKAGVKASLRQIQTLLSYGMTVRCFRLPEGIDPDDLAKKLGKEYLPQKIQQGEQSFEKYMFEVLDLENKEKEELIQGLDVICECIANMPDLDLQSAYISSIAALFKMSGLDVKKRVLAHNKTKVVIEEWKPGFYGVEEAIALLAKDKTNICELTFDRDLFISESHERPLIYVFGNPSTYDIQSLRTKVNRFRLSADEENIIPSFTESPEISVLKTLFKEGFDIQIDASVYNSNRHDEEDEEDEDSESFVSSDSYYDFCNFYIVGYGYLIAGETNGMLKSDMIERCAEVIAELKAAAREVMIKSYAKRLGVDKTALDKILKPILATKKDNSTFEKQRLAEMADIASVDPSELPEYVITDDILNKKHSLYNHYPLRNKQGEDVAYMYKNTAGNGYTRITDFVIDPMLHVYDKISQANKRVVFLRHMRPEYNRYVEWQSNTLANLTKVKEKLIEEGPYNFRGTNNQWNDIWAAMSYDFTYCRELRILGQHTSDVFAFGNAIFHKVKDQETGKHKYQVTYADKIGIVSHEGENFYLPAFSEIRISDFDKDDSYKQAVHFKYKEIPDKERIDFGQWTALMDEVYKINNNGKWAILYAITSAFRDFIFKERRFFTAPFFIGPTSSGKSQIATSIRSLFVSPDMPLFNLNTGSFASLTMIMEQFRNVPVVLEEYNDKIDETKFQLLKAAVLDGVGRTKVADTATKTTTSTEINSPLVLLGQEAPQKDDGSLGNRSILRDVPYVDKGEFSEHETEIYLRLKKHEHIGLCNVLTEILSLRDLFEKEYLQVFDKEVKLLKEKVKQSVTNTDGLTRIINAVSLLTATCKLVERHTNLNLPFTYDKFFDLAVTQVVSQLEQIATTNKLAAFFNAMNTLLTRGKTVPGRDFRIKPETSVRRVLKGKDTEELKLEAGMNVLYLDLNALYSDYESFVGKDAAAPMQTLVMNFKSNEAYLGYNRGVRYGWTEFTHGTQGGTDYNGEVDKRAVPKIESRSRTGSAHMFNYDMLKTKFEIDFDRVEQKEPKQNDDEPPIFKLTSPDDKTEDDLPF